MTRIEREKDKILQRVQDIAAGVVNSYHDVIFDYGSPSRFAKFFMTIAHNLELPEGDKSEFMREHFGPESLECVDSWDDIVNHLHKIGVRA